jgi:hypothetical protein
MTQITKTFAVCLLGLALVASSLPGTAGAETDRTNRKLLQGGYRDRTSMTNLNANTVRAQAATSQVSRVHRHREYIGGTPHVHAKLAPSRIRPAAAAAHSQRLDHLSGAHAHVQDQRHSLTAT